MWSTTDRPSPDINVQVPFVIEVFWDSCFHSNRIWTENHMPELLDKLQSASTHGYYHTKSWGKDFVTLEVIWMEPTVLSGRKRLVIWKRYSGQNTPNFTNNIKNCWRTKEAKYSKISASILIRWIHLRPASSEIVRKCQHYWTHLRNHWWNMHCTLSESTETTYLNQPLW